MSEPKFMLTKMYARLIAADHAYIKNPTSQNNLAICRAQRTYYAELTHYNRSVYLTQDASLLRAKAMKRRAQQNLKRERNSVTWQQLAQHQLRRADRICMRVLAQTSTPASPPVRKPPSAKRRKRIIHPITRRYIYSDQD